MKASYRLLCAIGALYILLLPLTPPDFAEFYDPWLKHIDQLGPVAVFGSPFANYAPPYLYLLAALSAFGLPHLLIIKLIAVASVCVAAFGAVRLVRSLGGDASGTCALFVAALPTAIFNGPGLGQCDGLWAGPCLLAIAAALDRNVLAAAVWAGLAFAFKSQAAFVAPIILGAVIREREWRAFLIPPIIYLIAITPAWLAGWPLADLLTIYFQQAAAWFEGNAPNAWAIPIASGYVGLFTLGYITAGIAAVGLTVLTVRRGASAELALLSAILLPFVLPKMHERYFFLADILSFCIAWVVRDRRSILICGLIQVASLGSIIAYLTPSPWLDALSSVVMACALCLALAILWRPSMLLPEQRETATP